MKIANRILSEKWNLPHFCTHENVESQWAKCVFKNLLGKTTNNHQICVDKPVDE